MVEKLALQVDSFQEAFEILSRSYNFNEMTKNFIRLLKANFFLVDIYLFYKSSSFSEWERIGIDNQTDSHDLSFLEESKRQRISYYENHKYNAAVILPLSDSSCLGILLGQKLDGTVFSDFDKITLQILLQVFNSAHKSFLNQKKEKELIFDLNEKVFQLNNLIDTGIELSRYEKRNVLFELALERVSSLTNSSSALIRIVNKDNGNSVRQYVFPPKVDPDKVVNCPFRIESSFEHFNKSYQFVLSEKETRNGTTSFNELDELLLFAVCRQVRVVIENEYLQLQNLEKERMEKELDVAASIQQRILPKELPAIEGYEIAGINIPSREVGGDYYDCIKLNNDRYALIIADVAGKGIAAALLVNTLSAALYSYLEFNLPLTDMADKLNKLIYNSSPPDKFITFFIAVLDSKSGELDIVNAGHNPIFLLRKIGELEKIEAGSIGLGMMDFGIPFPGQKLNMTNGDKLFLYTDGIPEAMNEKEEEYSDERMINFFCSHSDKPAKEFIDLIVKDVKNFVGETEQSDDITVLEILRK
jgi:sigma-B regulation protein RsbU (phosphoserine phosphatase)